MTDMPDAGDSGAGLRQLPYDRFRRVTSRRMTTSVTTKPQVTLHRHANVAALERALAEARTHQAGSPLGFTAALLAALARGLTGSRLNGTVTDQVIFLHESV